MAPPARGVCGTARASEFPLSFPPGVAGPSARKRTIAIGIGIGIATLAGEKAIGDAIQPPARCGCLALCVGVKGATAQGWILLALQAEWMSTADRLRRRGTQERKAACGKRGNEDLAHLKPPGDWVSVSRRTGKPALVAAGVAEMPRRGNDFHRRTFLEAPAISHQFAAFQAGAFRPQSAGRGLRDTDFKAPRGGLVRPELGRFFLDLLPVSRTNAAMGFSAAGRMW